MKFIFPYPATVTTLPAKKMTRKRMSCLEKWGHKCVYCKTDLTVESMTFDHLIPKSKGGKKGLHNLVPSCQMCNTLRGNFESLKEFDELIVKTRAIVEIAEKIISGKIKPVGST